MTLSSNCNDCQKFKELGHSGKQRLTVISQISLTANGVLCVKTHSVYTFVNFGLDVTDSFSVD